jgi:hypothetical protein
MEVLVATKNDNSQRPPKIESAMANDSAIWMQRDAHWSKGPADPSKLNPFVQAQVAP